MEDGKTVAEPADKPTRNGYDFVNWYSGEAAYDFSTIVTADLTLTAKWKAHEYKITYELNGGTNHADNPATYTIESEDITLKAPTGPATAPVFQGWYSDKDFLNRVSPAVITKGSTGDKTFYARFGTETLKEFTVTFNVVAEANGIVLGSDSTKVNDGDKISDAQLEAAKAKIASIDEGQYEFVKLCSDAELKNEFNNNETAIKSDTTLYVLVKVKMVKVTFDTDGGSSVDPAEVPFGSTVAKPAEPTKDGYTFNGWDFDFSTAIKADTTVKAKWVEAKPYTVWVAETSKDYTASASYGQIVVYNDADNAFSVGAGDWLIVNATVKFDNIGQTYAGLCFTKTGAESADYPSLDGFYTTKTGTNSTDYYVIYKFADAGKVHFISFNNGVADGTAVAPLAGGKTVTLDNLKIVHVASDKVDTVFTKIVKEDSVTASWKDGENSSPGSYEYAPDVNFDIKAGSKLSVIYTRDAISEDYKSHYINSALGWEAAYPSKDAQTISKSIPVSEDKTVNWLHIGIQCTKSADTMTFTNVEIRVMPGMDSFN